MCSHVVFESKDYSAISGSLGSLNGFVSECESALDFLDESDPEDVLVLDDGSALHDGVPNKLCGKAAGVEQTSFGIRNSWKYPVVLVCRSAAKLTFESQIIARGILRKLDSLGVRSVAGVGVIGLGALGAEVARALLARNWRVHGFDIGSVPADLRFVALSLDELIGRCDVVIGCTGTDVLAGVNISSFCGHKTFISCSSSNIEFRSVMGRLPSAIKFSDVSGSIGRLNAAVLNGGYPINFDRKNEWELFEEILLTRKLLLAGLIQARTHFGKPARGIMLDPEEQLRIVSEWLEDVPDRNALRVPKHLTREYFLTHSEGEFELSESRHYLLHHTTPGALEKMRSHTEPYEFVVSGLPIIILPNVWSPAYDWSSLFYVENFPKVTGLDFLEIGCGSGVLSVFAGLNGATKVCAVDVNPDAVRNTKLNFEKLGVKNAEALISDGFSSVRGLFDVITWNAPYHGNRPDSVLERGCSDEDYKGIRDFFRDVGRFLKPGGMIVFGFSESGDLPLIEALIGNHGYRVKQRLSDWRENYNCMLFTLVWSKSNGG